MPASPGQILPAAGVRAASRDAAFPIEMRFVDNSRRRPWHPVPPWQR